ncbi:FHA domain-containing protein [Streptomyces sp. BHT-5-2]|uniref:FtsK/SpoIIIE domain-containing protein n=1 Tax=Streptomyces sp. BHT-5-2 TaxID=2866715 RepID=UPI001C8D3281|nr:FtsK/SpoIIIE domain-containing protein [Streptomyces sp. BHT-5-2]QZL06581.1 FHA domain-containing protein [Streptomyces sp. BHT-5-2]
MQIRLTVLGPRSGHTTRACDVLVTAPAGTALATVAGSLAAAVAGSGADVGTTGSSAPVVLYAGTERLDPQRAALGEPPLIDGAVLTLQGPGPAPAHGLPHGSARLRVVSGPDAGGVHLLHGGQVRIGRSADADVPLDDPDVSRLHCAVTVEADGSVYVADLRSTNGTAVDGTELGDLAVPLPPGALLRIGESALRLQPPPRTPDPALRATPDGEGHLRVAPGGAAAGGTALGEAPSATGETASGSLYAGAGYAGVDGRGHRRVPGDGDAYGAGAGGGIGTGSAAPHGRGDAGAPPTGDAQLPAAGAPAPDGPGRRRDTPLRGIPAPAVGEPDGGATPVGAGGVPAPSAGGLFPIAAPGPAQVPGARGAAVPAPVAGGSGTAGAAVGTNRAAGAHGPGPAHGGPVQPAPVTDRPATEYGTAEYGAAAYGATEYDPAAYGAARAGHAPGHDAPAGHEALAGRGPAPTGGQTHGGQQSLAPADPVTRKAGRRGGLGAWARRLAGGRPATEHTEQQDPASAPAGRYDTTDADGAAQVAGGPSDMAAGSAPVPSGPAADERWPDAAAVLLTALGPGPRLWERGPEHPDSLTVRLGTAERDGGRTAAPVTVEMRRAGALGLAGPRDRLVGLARSAAAQLAALHSPGTLEIVLVGSDRARPLEERVADWSWLGWLPHVRPARGQDCRLLLAYDKEQAAARTAELVRRLDDGPLGPGWPSAERAEVAAAAARHQGPYTLLIVDGDPGSSALRETTARLAAGGPAAGIHVLCLAETPAASPAFPLAATYEAARAASPAFGECGAVAVLSGDVATALRVVQPGSGPNGTVATVDAVSAAWAERFARALAPLREAEAGGGAGGAAAPRAAIPLPESTRLLDELGLARATPASLMARWAAAQDTDRPHAAAVLGAGPHGPVTADLAADGSHLLVEGAPATGKTELLRSLAASLAAADRPDRLALVLVDGGGAERGEGLRVCTDLPHVTTYLAASDPLRMREFAQALSSELKRRAEILAGTSFSEWRTKHLPAPRIIAPRRSTEGTPTTPGTATPLGTSMPSGTPRPSEASGASGPSMTPGASSPPGTPPTSRVSPTSGASMGSAASVGSGAPMGSGASPSVPAPHDGTPAAPHSPSATPTSPFSPPPATPPTPSAPFTPSTSFTTSNESEEQITLRNRCRNKEEGGDTPAGQADPTRTGTLRLRARPGATSQEHSHPDHHDHRTPADHRDRDRDRPEATEPHREPNRSGASAQTTASAAAPAPPTAAPMPRLFVLVDDFDALVSPALGSTGRPAAGSVVRALEAVARDGAALGVHLVAATGHPDRTDGTATAERAALRIQLGGLGGLGTATDSAEASAQAGAEPTPPGRGRLHRAADGTSTPFQAGRVTGRIPRTSTLRPTVVPLEWARMGDPPARRPLRELGNGPTDLALLASALQRAAQSSGATAGPPLV